MNEDTTSAKEALRAKWAKLPFVHFAEEKKKNKEEKKERNKKRVKKLIPEAPRVCPPKLAYEIDVKEAAEIMGISENSVRILLNRRYIVARDIGRPQKGRGSHHAYVMRKDDVYTLWARLCEFKGIKKGEKLGNLSFLQYVPKSQRLAFYVRRNFDN